MLKNSPNSFDAESDEDLIVRYRNSHDISYIGLLYKRYMFLVFGICLKYLKNRALAEDASMEIFELLIKLLKKHEVKQFKSWLYQVSKNHCLMELRKQKKEITFNEDFTEEKIELMDLDSTHHHISEFDDTEEVLESINTHLESLKLEQKQCLSLFYYEKKSYEEITTITGYTYNQVKSHIQNGKRNLKILMEKNEQE